VNLQTAIDPRLWNAVSAAFESKSYTAAILDAVYFVADLIREKTGLQSDGVALIGQAFGGKAPALKVNKLQTDTERNVQSGLEQLLKGVFQTIRNPRSHEKTTDGVENAIAIILFLNYLIGLIDRSKTVFSESEFLNRIFDKHFVAKDRYAKLLVASIPLRQRLDVAISVYRRKKEAEGDKLRYFTQALYAELSEDERTELIAVIAEELRSTDDESDFRSALQLFPNETLARLPEDVRLRLESRLLKSVSEGDYDQKNGRCRKGGLGTWLNNRVDNLLLRDELVEILIGKLYSADTDEHAYVAQYFSPTLALVAQDPPRRLVLAFKSALRSGSAPAKDLVDRLIFNDSHKLTELLSKEIEAFAAKTSGSFDDDEIPF